MTKSKLFTNIFGLRAGDWVEVRSAEEIFATLDEQGCLEALPFMPEMLKYCGQRFHVYKRADKTCNTIEYSGSRRMFNTVHLEGTRCSGEAHGGCQAGCLLFWKEAWLRRVDDKVLARSDSNVSKSAVTSIFEVKRVNPASWTEARLLETTYAEGSNKDGQLVYRCQATELRRASAPLAWWDIRQYIRDILSRNVRISHVISALLFRGFRSLLRFCGYRILIFLYDTFQKWRGGMPFPFKDGTLTKTPRLVLGLKPGELVQVKSHEEILKTLNTRNRNHGLSFDVEMVRYCGGVYRVLDRVARIIDEKTGKMIELSTDCIILDGVVCRGQFSHRRLFCPRSLYPFWREIWLKRLEETVSLPETPGADVYERRSLKRSNRG
jgi:hypothetical protein